MSSAQQQLLCSTSDVVIITNRERCTSLSLGPLFILYFSTQNRRDRVQIRNEKPLITFLCLHIFKCDEICPSRRFMENVRTARPRASQKQFLAIQEERNSGAINAITSLEWMNFSFLNQSPQLLEAVNQMHSHPKSKKLLNMIILAVEYVLSYEFFIRLFIYNISLDLYLYSLNVIVNSKFKLSCFCRPSGASNCYH